MELGNQPKKRTSGPIYESQTGSIVKHSKGTNNKRQGGPPEQRTNQATTSSTKCADEYYDNFETYGYCSSKSHFSRALESTIFHIHRLVHKIDNEIGRLRCHRDLPMHDKQQKMKKNAAIQNDITWGQNLSSNTTNIEFSIDKYSSQHKFVCTSPRYARDEQTLCRPRMRTIGLQKNINITDKYTTPFLKGKDQKFNLAASLSIDKCSVSMETMPVFCFDYGNGDSHNAMKIYYPQSIQTDGCRNSCPRCSMSGNYNGVICNRKSYMETGVTPCSEYNYCRNEYFYDYSNLCRARSPCNAPSSSCRYHDRSCQRCQSHGRRCSDLNTEDICQQRCVEARIHNSKSPCRKSKNKLPKKCMGAITDRDRSQSKCENSDVNGTKELKRERRSRRCNTPKVEECQPEKNADRRLMIRSQQKSEQEEACYDDDSTYSPCNKCKHKLLKMVQTKQKVRNKSVCSEDNLNDFGVDSTRSGVSVEIMEALKKMRCEEYKPTRPEKQEDPCSRRASKRESKPKKHRRKNALDCTDRKDTDIKKKNYAEYINKYKQEPGKGNNGNQPKKTCKNEVREEPEKRNTSCNPSKALPNKVQKDKSEHSQLQKFDTCAGQQKPAKVKKQIQQPCTQKDTKLMRGTSTPVSNSCTTDYQNTPINSSAVSSQRRLEQRHQASNNVCVPPACSEVSVPLGYCREQNIDYGQTHFDDPPCMPYLPRPLQDGQVQNSIAPSIERDFNFECGSLQNGVYWNEPLQPEQCESPIYNPLLPTRLMDVDPRQYNNETASGCYSSVSNNCIQPARKCISTTLRQESPFQSGYYNNIEMPPAICNEYNSESAQHGYPERDGYNSGVSHQSPHRSKRQQNNLRSNFKCQDDLQENYLSYENLPQSYSSIQQRSQLPENIKQKCTQQYVAESRETSPDCRSNRQQNKQQHVNRRDGLQDNYCSYEELPQSYSSIQKQCQLPENMHDNMKQKSAQQCVAESRETSPDRGSNRQQNKHDKCQDGVQKNYFSYGEQPQSPNNPDCIEQRAQLPQNAIPNKQKPSQKYVAPNRDASPDRRSNRQPNKPKNVKCQDGLQENYFSYGEQPKSQSPTDKQSKCSQSGNHKQVQKTIQKYVSQSREVSPDRGSIGQQNNPNNNVKCQDGFQDKFLNYGEQPQSYSSVDKRSQLPQNSHQNIKQKPSQKCVTQSRETSPDRRVQPSTISLKCNPKSNMQNDNYFRGVSDDNFYGKPPISCNDATQENYLSYEEQPQSQCSTDKQSKCPQNTNNRIKQNSTQQCGVQSRETSPDRRSNRQQSNQQNNGKCQDRLQENYFSDDEQPPSFCSTQTKSHLRQNENRKIKQKSTKQHVTRKETSPDHKAQLNAPFLCNSQTNTQNNNYFRGVSVDNIYDKVPFSCKDAFQENYSSYKEQPQSQLSTDKRSKCPQNANNRIKQRSTQQSGVQSREPSPDRRVQTNTLPLKYNSQTNVQNDNYVCGESNATGYGKPSVKCNDTFPQNDLYYGEEAQSRSSTAKQPQLPQDGNPKIKQRGGHKSVVQSREISPDRRSKRQQNNQQKNLKCQDENYFSYEDLPQSYSSIDKQSNCPQNANSKIKQKSTKQHVTRSWETSPDRKVQPNAPFICHPQDNNSFGGMSNDNGYGKVPVKCKDALQENYLSYDEQPQSKSSIDKQSKCSQSGNHKKVQKAIQKYVSQSREVSPDRGSIGQQNNPNNNDKCQDGFQDKFLNYGEQPQSYSSVDKRSQLPQNSHQNIKQKPSQKCVTQSRETSPDRRVQPSTISLKCNPKSNMQNDNYFRGVSDDNFYGKPPISCNDAIQENYLSYEEQPQSQCSTDKQSKCPKNATNKINKKASLSSETSPDRRSSRQQNNQKNNGKCQDGLQDNYFNYEKQPQSNSSIDKRSQLSQNANNMIKQKSTQQCCAQSRETSPDRRVQPNAFSLKSNLQNNIQNDNYFSAVANGNGSIKSPLKYTDAYLENELCYENQLQLPQNTNMNKQNSAQQCRAQSRETSPDRGSNRQQNNLNNNIICQDGFQDNYLSYREQLQSRFSAETQSQFQQNANNRIQQNSSQKYVVSGRENSPDRRVPVNALPFKCSPDTNTQEDNYYRAVSNDNVYGKPPPIPHNMKHSNKQNFEPKRSGGGLDMPPIRVQQQAYANSGRSFTNEVRPLELNYSQGPTNDVDEKLAYLSKPNRKPTILKSALKCNGDERDRSPWDELLLGRLQSGGNGSPRLEERTYSSSEQQEIPEASTKYEDRRSYDQRGRRLQRTNSPNPLLKYSDQTQEEGTIFGEHDNLCYGVRRRNEQIYTEGDKTYTEERKEHLNYVIPRGYKPAIKINSDKSKKSKIVLQPSSASSSSCSNHQSYMANMNQCWNVNGNDAPSNEMLGTQFTGCPCMLRTYENLVALCDTGRNRKM